MGDRYAVCHSMISHPQDTLIIYKLSRAYKTLLLSMAESIRTNLEVFSMIDVTRLLGR